MEGLFVITNAHRQHFSQPRQQAYTTALQTAAALDAQRSRPILERVAVEDDDPIIRQRALGLLRADD